MCADESQSDDPAGGTADDPAQFRVPRRQPLPGSTPKPAEEDATAPARVEHLLASAGYLQADQDVAFLNQYETRCLRLQLDYLKAELLLEKHGIEHSIVVFGSTRIPEPKTAQMRLEQARTAHAADPANPELRRRVAIAERVAAKSAYYEVAREFARLVGQASVANNARIVVMTGGGPGLMEAANRGAHDVGAKSVGLNIALPHQQFPNPYVTPELCFKFHYFALRKLHFLLRAKALVAFPGGYGTFDELFETLTLIQTRTIDLMPVVLVGEDYWRRAIDFEFLSSEGVIDVEDRELFFFADTAEQIWAGILDWYRTSGTPLLSPA